MTKLRDYSPGLYEGKKVLPSDIIGANLSHPYGNTYYVKKSTDADFSRFFNDYNFINNRGRKTVYTTVTLALAAAEAGDTIFICPGFYSEGAVLNITQQGLRLLGPGKDNLAITGLKTNSNSHHIITVNANDVEIAGLSFFGNESGYDAIRVDTGTAAFKCHIHDCKFDGGGAGEYAIYLGDTMDAPDCLIENNLFRSWDTACIRANATRAVIRNNLFLVYSSKAGIVYVPTTGSRPDGQILDNRFMCTDGTNAIGISLSGSPTAGMLFIDGNHFSMKFNATNKTITAADDGQLGVNYRGHAVITAS